MNDPEMEYIYRAGYQLAIDCEFGIDLQDMAGDCQEEPWRLWRFMSNKQRELATEIGTEVYFDRLEH
jgi:hypothetical protein